MGEEKKNTGLPMAGKWDPEKIRAEEEYLQDLDTQPFGKRIKGYFKMTGPAWMQSAMTLGAGSAAASVVAGAFFGYELLWVQPIAMFLGVFMMAALSNITLTKGERGYEVVKRELHPSIAFFWAVATVVSTVIWHFGQYALLGGAFWDMANVAGIENAGDSKTIETVVRFVGGFIILGINIALTWNYGGKSKGIKFYESFLSWTIRAVMAAFLIVVLVQAVKLKVDWGAVFKGFFTITIPMVLPFLMLAVLFRGIENFKMFDLVVQLTGGGPGSVTELTSINLKREAFEKWRTGYASAYAIILFVTVFGLASIYVKALNKVKER